MKLLWTKSKTSAITHIFIQDSSSTVGAGKTGLVFNTANLVSYYVKPGGTLTSLTLETIASLGTYATPSSAAHMRFKLMHDTNAPGLYEIQVHPDTLATNDSIVIVMHGASDMALLLLEIQLTDFDLNDATPAVNVTKIAGSIINTASAQLGVNVVSEDNIDFGAIKKASITTACDTSCDTVTVTAYGGSLDFNATMKASITTACDTSCDTVTVTSMANNVITAAALATDAITEIITALKVSTGYTAGGTSTFAEVMKINVAFAAGIWQDKSGSPGTYQLLDADNGSTVILEITPSETTPYKTVTIP